MIIKLTLTLINIHRYFSYRLSFLFWFWANSIIIKIKNIRLSSILLVLFLTTSFWLMFCLIIYRIRSSCSKWWLTYLIYIYLTSSMFMTSNLAFVGVTTWSFLDLKRATLTFVMCTRQLLIITSFDSFLSHHCYVKLLVILDSRFIWSWYLLFSGTTTGLFNI